MRVLVVEDDRSVRETLGLVLESYEFSPDLVESGEGAIARLEAQWPDVMLLDLTLEGMSGEEVYENIRRKFGKVPPTVVLSAAQEAKQRASQMPGAKFLAKPYTLEQLIEILQETSGSRQVA